MHGWMTSRHEGCVSTMLTESGRKEPLPASLPPKNRACDFHRTRLKHNKSFYTEAGFTTFKPRL